MKAYKLQRVDKEYDMHLQAWINQQVKATREQGKKQVPVFKKFTDFFDYEKNINAIIEPKVRQLNDKSKRMARIASRLNAGKEVNDGSV